MPIKRHTIMKINQQNMDGQRGSMYFRSSLGSEFAPEALQMNVPSLGSQGSKGEAMDDKRAVQKYFLQEFSDRTS